MEKVLAELEASIAGRTGDRDLFFYYHHSAGTFPVFRPQPEDFPPGDDPYTSVLEALLRSDPTDYLFLRLLADHYTRSGRVKDGLRLDLALATLFPEEPTVFYNLACSWSLLGDVEKALGAFSKAVELGWDNFDFALRDEDLENLRSDPRFTVLIERLRDSGSQAPEEDRPGDA